MISTYIQGMAVGAGLIVAIGAQNAFVLSQGIRRQHHWLVAAICCCCDAVLIAVGVAGVGGAIAATSSLQTAAAWGGALFLFVYGARALRRAMANHSLQADGRRPGSVKEVVLTTLGVTLLNPHVYLDTVVLLGAISSQFPAVDRSAFAFGACSASILWFFGLSLGGVMLAPVFARPGSWRGLDLFVGLTMWLVAARLLPISG